MAWHWVACWDCCWPSFRGALGDQAVVVQTGEKTASCCHSVGPTSVPRSLVDV